MSARTSSNAFFLSRRSPARQAGSPSAALERDEILRGAMGEALAKEYGVMKRSEVRGFEGKDAAFEIQEHFYKY